MTCLVSVVMPVYNSRAYLKDAVDSILQEKSQDFELLLVDDGSTDGSSALCDEIEKQDNRVRVIHKQNGGMCQARNLGIQRAQGKWIAFADNDDKVLPGFIDDNITLAQKYDCDCLVFGRELRQIDSRGITQFSKIDCPRSEECLYAEDIKKNYFKCRNVSGAVWVRFFKQSMLIENNIVFDETFRNGFEDDYFNDMVINNAKSYAFNPRVYYIWHRRSSRSTSMRINENRLSSMKKMLSYEYCLLLENDLIDKAPSLCAELFFSRIFDILASSHLTGKCSYTTQKPVYETMYEIASSYKQVVNSRLPYPRLGLAKRLLLRKRFFFLHVYLSLGAKIKTASA